MLRVRPLPLFFSVLFLLLSWSRSVEAQPPTLVSGETVDIVFFIEQTNRMRENVDRFGEARYETVQHLIEYIAELYMAFIHPATEGALKIRIAVVNFHRQAEVIPNHTAVDGDAHWLELEDYLGRGAELNRHLESWFNTIEGCFQDSACTEGYSDYHAAEQYVFRELLDNNPNRHLIFIYLGEGWSCRTYMNCILFNNEAQHRERIGEIVEQRIEFGHTYGELSVYLLGLGSAVLVTRNILMNDGGFVVQNMDDDITPNYAIVQPRLFPTALGMLVEALTDPLEAYGIARYNISNSGLINESGQNYALPIESLQHKLHIVSAYAASPSGMRLNVNADCAYPSENSTQHNALVWLSFQSVTNPCGGNWTIAPAGTLRDDNLMRNDSVFVSMEGTEWSAFVIPKGVLQSNPSLSTLINSSFPPVQDVYQFEEVLLVVRVEPPNAYITNGTHTLSARVCTGVIAQPCPTYNLNDLAFTYATPLGEYWGVDVPIHQAGRYQVTFEINLRQNTQPVTKQQSFDSVLVSTVTRELQCAQAERGNPNASRPGEPWTARLEIVPERVLQRPFPTTLSALFTWNANVIPVTGVKIPIPFELSNQEERNRLRFEAQGQLPNERTMSVEVEPLFNGQPTSLGAFNCTFSINPVDAQIPQTTIVTAQGQPLQVSFSFPADDAGWLGNSARSVLEVQVDYVDYANIQQTWRNRFNLRNRIRGYQEQAYGYFDLDLSSLNMLSDIITIRYRILLSQEDGSVFLLFPRDDEDGWQSVQVQLRR